MLLYWGMFTVGFMFGAVFSFVTFAPKKPQEDTEYEANSLSKRTLEPTTFVLINKRHNISQEEIPRPLPVPLSEKNDAGELKL